MKEIGILNLEVPLVLYEKWKLLSSNAFRQ